MKIKWLAKQAPESLILCDEYECNTKAIALVKADSNEITDGMFVCKEHLEMVRLADG